MNSEVTPNAIIQAFDDCLEYVWSRNYGRDNPQKTDHETAQRWINEGLTNFGATIVFYEQMVRMHERWLRHDAASREDIPKAIKIFEENIQTMIYKLKHGAPEVWEVELSKWLARCRGWMKAPELWNTDMWGPAPNENGTRAPKNILVDLGIVKTP